MAVDKSPTRPTVPDVLPFIRSIYARNVAGCCLHVVTDDYNVDDDFVEHSIERARELGHADCLKAAEMLAAMTTTQRLKASRRK